ncbi:general L-amino acid transport system permease protein [Ketogulonicigenium robustum]|uniref:General L-amino acid transport system permease protein n=1 Tax=Ketogulonicigenium robustum TaxID=92947 RepID=A0A1W6P2J5_9RHOB|nr:ABC transporter permease subunit [Ketogulonicigenium robustum]ARO15517.1 general L-amino acid transport system permease protein [Ketogulonicigenium robustum]
MSLSTQPPKEPFRLGQLLSDTRYRSITIQVVALVLFALGLWWLIGNTAENLKNLGKTFSFDFLGQRSNYDINQRLIPYDSTSTHGRAALVGILNTLLVAAMGCVLATVIGVIAGVLRLSKNWLIARLMTVYIEGFRNVPLLLWILLIFALVSESAPAPRAFANGDANMILWGTMAITNRGIYVPSPVFTHGAWLIAAAFVVAVGVAAWLRRKSLREQAATGKPPLPLWQAAGVVLGLTGLVYLLQGGIVFTLLFVVQLAIIAAIFIYVRRFVRPALQYVPSQRASATATALGALTALLWAIYISPALWHMLTGVFGTPAFTPSITLDVPALGGFNFTGGFNVRNSLVALWLALSLYTGAFIAEVVRSGIVAVPKGQSEAAAALGMPASRSMSLVILPQAMRVIVPPMISQYLNLTKNSSLAIAVGYMDVRATLGGITINQTGRELEGMLLMGVFYLALSLIIAAAGNWFNARVKLKER